MKGTKEMTNEVANSNQSHYERSHGRFRIYVTKEILETAIKRDSHHCAVQMSIEDQIPWAKRITVDTQTIRFTDDRKKATGRWVRNWYLTPRVIQQYIVDWDAGKPVKPFSFLLKQPTKVTCSPMKSGGNGRNNNSSSSIKLTTRKNGGSTAELIQIDQKTSKTPPRSAPNSKRRTYGMRGLTY
jgi:hypothetical protein